jgi:hypothetical protein
MNRTSRPSPAALRRGEDTAWGPRPGRTDRPRMRLVIFTPCAHGALRGFATVELPIGLKLIDVPVFAGDRGPWATLPTKPQLDCERHQRLGANGKPLFSPAAEWRTRELAAQFSAAVVELIRADYPEALE